MSETTSDNQTDAPMYEDLDPNEAPDFEADELPEDWTHGETLTLLGSWAEGNPEYPHMSAEYEYDHFEVAETGTASDVPFDELAVDVVADGFEFCGREKGETYNHVVRIPAVWTPADVDGYAYYTVKTVASP